MAFEAIYYTLIGLSIIGVIVFWIYLETQFKNRVRIKEVVNGRRIIKNYRAKYYEDKKDKSAWWRLAGEKRKSFKLIPLPPEEAIEIDNKGKKYVEAYRYETGEVIFIKDVFESKQMPKFDIPPREIKEVMDNEPDYQKKKEILEFWKQEMRERWLKENNVIAPYQPVTTNQRMGYFANIKKSEARKTDTWKDKIVPITAISGLVLIVLGLMIFWGEIATPALQAGEITQNNLNIQKEIVDALENINLNQQKIESSITNTNDKLDQIGNRLDTLEQIPD